MFKIKYKLFINVFIGLIFILGILGFYTTFSLENEYKFESLVYDIKEPYIKNVSSNTSIELYSKYFDIDNCTIKVVDFNNEEIISGYVINGSKTIVYNNNHSVIGEYTNIIKGDFNGDGIIERQDFYDMGKCLVNDCDMVEYLKLSSDIDDDGEFNINDIILLDKAITLGYSEISIENNDILLQTNEVGRMVARVKPSYGVNLNVKWTSLDEEIATVDDAGRITGHKEGETVIRATTLDGKYSYESKVVVDNTIQLSSYSGVSYIGGDGLEVGIKSVDYDDITCSVSSKSIADCEIKDKKLIINAKNIGKTEVIVSSSKYGEVSFNLETISVYLNVMPKYLCMTPKNVTFITVSGFNTGNMSFESSDKEIIKSAYMEYYGTRNMLRINAGEKLGRATLTVKEDNGNTTNNVVVDITSIGISDIGKTAKVGEEVRTTITGGNFGDLSCKVNDESLGTCRIEGNELIVTPLKKGSIYVDIYNNFSYEDYYEECGKTMFLVLAQEG